ncbi:MAG: LTA synthase family protein, partial [Oscillospiraceae bacterium]|nr:LTA synthase family protein [Oscillospiraceae bacterium]
LWNLGLMLLACCVLTHFTLQLSIGNLEATILRGYSENLWIPFFNLLIVFSLCVFLFTVTGRAWFGFLLTAFICLGITLANYYLISMRSDPFYFKDISCLREALAITGTQEYEFVVTNPILDAIFSSLLCTIGLAILSRWRPRFSVYYFVWILATGTLFVCSLLATTVEKVNDLTENYKYIDGWQITQVYVSRGVLYSFSQSIFESTGKPTNYARQDAENLLERYPQESIPADKKVDVFVIMRESYTDLSKCCSDSTSLDFSCYDTYHKLVSEAVKTGTLVTNAFGGNTKDPEWSFLTGSYNPVEPRQPSNSYVWYLKEQGYRTEGAHPFNGWFYNRQNVNRYYGFDRYAFREDTFGALTDANTIAADDILFDEIWRMYEQSDRSTPYFNFSVTYEGHGPYSKNANDFSGQYVLTDATSQEGYEMNNYLGCIAHRDQELESLVSRFRSSSRPIVLLLYGDHKPVLGNDSNVIEAFTRYHINMDLSTIEGFYNYYTSDYVIWMNAAAKEKLGVSGQLQNGPTISSCYLMNVLFDTLHWGKGPAYLQAMEDMMQDFPVCSTKGLVSINGELRTSVPEEWTTQYTLLQSLSYYWQTQFRYHNLAEQMITS